jgi:hypothetical protein
MASIRYVKDRTAVDLDLDILTLQISVTIFTYDSLATCDPIQRSVTAIGLDKWMAEHHPAEPPKLPWMRNGTIAAEVRRSPRTYGRNIDMHMEAAVDWLALHLQNSGLLDEI